ncbi:NUDIX hydrolase [Neobacillus sp. K501]
MEPKWLDWAKQLQAIAQAGLTYSKDVFDLERFEQIRKISVDILNHHTEVESEVIKELFANENGYATPKVDIRAVIFHNGQILMVREKNDGKWALPGGWADIGLSPSEVAVKEVKEESGFDVQAIKLLAVTDYKKHPHPPSPYHVYKLFIHCQIIGGHATKGIETSDVQFFAENYLPPLSTARNTKSQIEKMFQYLKNPDEMVHLD